MNSTNTHSLSSTPLVKKKKIRILSIDGGGIKGILPGTILQELERKLQEKTGNPDARLSDYFDFMAGTSTGGLLVCTYLLPSATDPTRPMMTAEEALGLYSKRGGNIFSRTLMQKVRSLFGLRDEKYDVKGLEKELKDYLTPNTLIKDFLKPSLITAYDLAAEKPLFFTSADAKRRPAKNFKVWEVARATSAAPTYFEPAVVTSQTGRKFPLIDGGVIAPNPTICACTEVAKMDPADIPGWNRSEQPGIEDMMIVSVGTGSSVGDVGYEKMKNAGIPGWVRPIISIMMDGNNETVDFQLSMLCKRYEAFGERNYYRMDPNLFDADTAMDNASPRNLKLLREAGKKNAAKFDGMLEEIAEKLIANHQEEELVPPNSLITRMAS